MKTKSVLIIILLMLSGMSLFSQSRKSNFVMSGGPSLFLGTALPSGVGYGGGIGWQHNCKNRWRFTAGVEYAEFRGDIVTPIFSSTVDGFSILPVMVGVKYFAAKKMYLSGRTGVAVGIIHAGTHYSLSPGLGIELPAKRNLFDIGLNLMSVLGSSSFPENHLTYRGGYSYINLRIAYGF